MTGSGNRAESGSIADDLFKLRAGDAIEAARDALGGVYDPELGLDLVSLGLIYDVREEDGRLVVEMTLTTVGCPASESLPDMATAAVEEALGGAVAVEVRVVWDPPWDPSMLSETAATALGFRIR
ncbi:MAG: iron-sulfur cluster assembly protein [Nitrospiraceae bacterium]|nr:iron-sulfur cluster assembly protein [Nitrospiraceae bacterium]